VALSFAGQKAHPNAVHGRDLDEEDHPLPREWVAALHELAGERGLELAWVNCGLCVDERGMQESIPGPRRGSPADLAGMIEESHNTLAIATGD
jgi:tRNA 2-thiouridine synthesizing protein D